MPTIRAKLNALREEVGGYIVYAFQNLDCHIPDEQYIITVRFPNWTTPYIQIGEIGYLQYKEVVAGRDTWWDQLSKSPIVYNYDNIIFLDFIREQQEEQTVLL